jgi:hypothetical protein
MAAYYIVDCRLPILIGKQKQIHANKAQSGRGKRAIDSTGNGVNRRAPARLQLNCFR